MSKDTQDLYIVNYTRSVNDEYLGVAGSTSSKDFARDSCLALAEMSDIVKIDCWLFGENGYLFRFIREFGGSTRIENKF